MTERPLTRTQQRQLRLDSLELLATKVRNDQKQIPERVIEARRLRATWEQIGEALGITRQAAWEKYHELVEEAEAEREQVRPAWH